MVLEPVILRVGVFSGAGLGEAVALFSGEGMGESVKIPVIWLEGASVVTETEGVGGAVITTGVVCFSSVSRPSFTSSGVFPFMLKRTSFVGNRRVCPGKIRFGFGMELNLRNSGQRSGFP